MKYSDDDCDYSNNQPDDLLGLNLALAALFVFCMTVIAVN